MPSLPTFPSLDLTNFDLSRFKVPNVTLPELNFPNVTTGQLDVDRALSVARDAAYVGIGLTVLAIQQTQVRRREIQKDVERTVRSVRERIG
jgi:hypothetical protein